MRKQTALILMHFLGISLSEKEHHCNVEANFQILIKGYEEIFFFFCKLHR